MTPQEKAIKEIQEWLDGDTSFLSTRTDYGRGYKEGIDRAKEIVQTILNYTVNGKDY